ncbi:MAG: radical SAM protein [Myxococcales bacterium]|nr:radical SAM protein [Myxococcales bacterium]
MSRANALEILRLALQARFDFKHQLYLIHAVTARCNARCGFCAWNPEFYEGSDELTTDEIKTLYADAREAGFVALSLWGGEPLLRPDIGELLEYAHGLGFVTHIVTNGALLERKLDRVVPHLDRISISLDHPSSHHDTLRGVKGLYGKILSATLKIRARYPRKKIVFVYTIQRENADPKTLEEMAQLMKQLGVSGVFNGLRLEAATDDTTIDLDKYNPSTEALAGAYATLRDLKRRGYPIVNSFTHIDKMMDLPMHYRCHWPKYMLPIEANGDVVDCMHWGQRPIANLRSTPLARVLEHPRLRALAGDAGEACHKCLSVHRVEISEICQGNFEPLASWAQVR